MARDFKDLRFSAQGGALPYWVEINNSGANAAAWVRLPANVTKIYYHYGRGPAVSESGTAGLSTLFFDDLESGAVASARWDTKNNQFGDASIGIKTDQKYNNYSIGIDESDGDGGDSGYDHCHTLIKIPLTSVPVNTTFSISLRAIRWKNTTNPGTFCGLGYGGTSDSAAELYNFPVDTAWHEYTTTVTRTATSTWTFTIIKDGVQVYTGSKTKTFSTNFIYGVQTRKSLGQSNYVRLDNVLAWLGPAPSLQVLSHYPAQGSQAAALSMESAQTYLGMAPGYALQDQPVSAQTAIQAAPDFSEREITGGGTNTGMQAQAETHDISIQAETAMTLQVQADPLKYYMTVEAGTGAAAAVTRKDYLNYRTEATLQPGYGAVKFETLRDYAVVSADVSRTVTDAVWQLQTEFIGPQAPGAFFPIHHEAVDHEGVTRHLFTGIAPTVDKEVGSTGVKTRVTAYDYGWYLSAQYVPDDARTVEIDTSWWTWGRNTWQEWINYLLEDTGITAYRIRTGPSTYWKQFVFSNTTTKKQAIDEISKYCNYIFEVKWRDYGTLENPDWRPVAYWVPEAEIDDADDGLDIPAPVTLTWPDPTLVDLPTVATNPEERVNRVRIIGSNGQGTFYQATRETAAVTAGTELPREYMEESSNLTSQTAVTNYAVSMLNYFTRPGVTVQMKFINRFDLQLYQKIKFGTGFPQELYELTDGRDSINYLRIVGIKYHTEEANNYVEVTAVYDHPIVIIKNRQRYLKPNWFTEVESSIKRGIEQQIKAVAGTIDSISSDGKTAVLLTEFGSRINVRIQ